MKYKVGDTVRVRDWDDMEKQYGLNGNGDIALFPIFNKSMKQYCGTEHKIKDVGEDDYILRGVKRWAFTDEMVLFVYSIKGKSIEIDWCDIFGVKPEQEFILKRKLYAHDVKCRVHENKLQRESKGKWTEFPVNLNDICHMEIIDFFATQDEKTILKSLCKRYVENGTIRRKGENLYIKDEFAEFNLPYPHLFQYIQPESGEVPIKDIIGE